MNLNNRDEVLSEVQKNCHVFKNLPTKYTNDKEIALTAIKQNGLLLEYASDELKNDREVVCAAIKENGMAITCANPRFKNDENLMFMAVNTNGMLLTEAPDEFKDKKLFAVAAMENSCSKQAIMQSLSPRLQNDQDINDVFNNKDTLIAKTLKAKVKEKLNSIIHSISEHKRSISFNGHEL